MAQGVRAALRGRVPFPFSGLTCDAGVPRFSQPHEGVLVFPDETSARTFLGQVRDAGASFGSTHPLEVRVPTSHTAHGRARIGAVAGLVATLLVAPTLPALAAETITTQPYVERFNMGTWRAEGLDGSGVRVGLIDGRPDLTVPELRGADVQVTDLCQAPGSRTPSAHGTAMLGLMASPDFGMAPKASYHVYVAPTDPDTWPAECRNEGYGDASRLVQQALNDGMDVIVLTTTSDNYEADSFALLRAADAGVPVVIAVNNRADSKDAGNAEGNGSIGVGGMDLRTDQPGAWNRTSLGITVMAPGAPISARLPDAQGRLTRIVHDTEGNSNAAPLVAGTLALGRQKYPDAHGNQLIHSLIATAGNPQDHNWVRGYGNARPNPFLRNDPREYPTTSPVMNKLAPGQAGNLTEQQIADYRDGLVHPNQVRGDGSYVYRGDDPVACAFLPAERCLLGTSPRGSSASPTPTASPAGGEASPAPSGTSAQPSGPASSLVVGVLAGLAVVGVGVGAVVLRRRGRG